MRNNLRYITTCTVIQKVSTCHTIVERSQGLTCGSELDRPATLTGPCLPVTCSVVADKKLRNCNEDIQDGEDDVNPVSIEKLNGINYTLELTCT